MSDINLADLEILDRSALRARWAEVYGNPPPGCFYVKRLIQGIAYRQQVLANPELQRAEQRLKKQLRLAAPTGSLPGHVRLHPGARLLREWNGVTHDVTVTESGFVYQDCTYKSLSAIARAITGTRWSGPAFFGLIA